MKKGVDYIGVTSATHCFHPDGKLLMVHRTDKCRDEHWRWDTVGGGMEMRETFEELARREVWEEMYVKLTDIHVTGVRNILRTQDGIQTHWVCIVMTGIITNPGEVKVAEPEKFDQWGWFDIDDLPSPLHSQFDHQFACTREWKKNHTQSV